MSSNLSRTQMRRDGMKATFNLQGHRGARGLRLENTLPSFEIALDLGVTSVETDLHLSQDRHVILCHDPILPGGALVAALPLADLRRVIVAGNSGPGRFPQQLAIPTPLATEFARARSIHPFGLPTLDDLFEFIQSYSVSALKSPAQRAEGARLIADLELKRIPGRPQFIGDSFDGIRPALFEECVVQTIRRHDMVNRCVVRSFDHRCVCAIKQLEPRLLTAILVRGTALLRPEAVVQTVGAEIYCPEAEFLDEQQVQRLHQAGIAVVPWTVNEAGDWQRLLTWGVDGITTDYPDRLAAFTRGED
jgi:glycerophosphoryl diester phosphodiesterase